MIELNTKYLKALLTVAPKNDIHDYLNGIRIEPAANGSLLYVATDGHMLVVLEQLDVEVDTSSAKPCILPRAAVENALKLAGKRGTVELCCHDDGTTTLRCATSVIDASALKDRRYPDWRVVTPSYDNVATDNSQSEKYQLAPHLLQRAASAFGLAAGMPAARAKELAIHVMPNKYEGGAAVCVARDVNGMAVVMPINMPNCMLWSPPPPHGEDSQA